MELKTNWIKLSLFVLLGYFSYLMLLITWQYIPIDFNAAFLNTKQEEIALDHYKLAFFTHVYTSFFALLAGFVQFSGRIRELYPRIHRGSGYFYVGIVLFLAAPSGLILGYYANGGWTAELAFCLLAILWFVFTYTALKKAISGDYYGHRAYMYRSYALTLSAITLRLWKWLIVAAFEPAPMDAYRVVAWIAWLINLAIAELYLIRSKNRKP